MNYISQIQSFKADCNAQNCYASLRQLLQETGEALQKWFLASIKGGSSSMELDPLKLVPEDLHITDRQEAKDYCLSMGIPLVKSGPQHIIVDNNIIGNYLYFVDTMKKNKVGVLQNLAVRNATQKGGEPIEIERLADSSYGIYRVNTMLLTDAKKNAKTTDGKLKLECQAIYNRWPQDGVSYGAPKRRPAWLKEGEGCNECRFAPHKKGKDDRSPEWCRSFYTNIVFVRGILQGQEAWIGPLLFEVSGVWGFNLCKASEPKGMFGYDTPTHVCRMGQVVIEQKGNKNKTVEDLTKERNGFCVPGDATYNHCRSITAAFDRLRRLRNTPIATADGVKEETPIIVPDQNVDDLGI